MSFETNEFTKRFLENLSDFSDKLNKHRKNLECPEECIYDECRELERIVQSETELIISNIKRTNSIDVNIEENLLNAKLLALIDNVQEECKEIIANITIFEKEAKSYWTDKQINKFEDFISNSHDKQFKYTEFINESKEFVQFWSNASFVNLNDETKVLKAIDILEDYEFELKDLSINTKLYIFNNNCIELSRIDDKSVENKLNYYVYCIKTLDLNKASNKFDTNQILNYLPIQRVKDGKPLKCVSFNILDDGSYFVIFSAHLNELNYAAIYDPVQKQIKREKYFETNHLDEVEVFINKDLIALRLSDYNQDSNKLVIINQDLEILKEMPNIDIIYWANRSFIYASKKIDSNSLIQFDWSLAKIKSLTFQSDDSTKKFYFENLNSFGKKNFNFMALKNLYFLKSDRILIIYNEFGVLLKKLTFDYYFTFNTDHMENFLIYKIKNETASLVYLDLNGKTIKEIHITIKKIISYKYTAKFYSNGRIFFHNNEQIYFQD